MRQGSVNDQFVRRRLCVGAASKAELLKKLTAAGVELNEYARVLFEKEWFTTSAAPSEIETVEASVAMLGYPQGASFAHIIEGRRPSVFQLVPLSWLRTSGFSTSTKRRGISIEHPRSIVHRLGP